MCRGSSVSRWVSPQDTGLSFTVFTLYSMASLKFPSIIKTISSAYTFLSLSSSAISSFTTSQNTGPQADSSPTSLLETLPPEHAIRTGSRVFPTTFFALLIFCIAVLFATFPSMFRNRYVYRTEPSWLLRPSPTFSVERK